MNDVMRGTRVLEVASWTFVPAAGAVLADWGADVIKIEHPETGDPQRGLSTLGLMPGGAAGVDFMMEVPNRGKRSVGVNLATDEGREVLYRLVESSDVFLTNFLPDVRERLQIDVQHIRARNPRIIYARGHGQGTKGPDARKGGFDGASYWSRGGVGDTLTPAGHDGPIGLRPAFGDVMGGVAIAAGIAAALYSREKTGEPSVVDVSLLNTAMWNIQPDIVMTEVLGLDEPFRFKQGGMANPMVGNYETKDGRWLFLNMMQGDRYWSDFCTHLARPDLIDDPRFADSAARTEHGAECIAVLREIFASKTLEEWRDALETMEGVWAPVQRAPELAKDRQVGANGYLRPVRDSRGNEFNLVAAPVQFDETHPDLRCAPLHGEHTDEVLLELGLSWDELIELKTSGAIL